MKHKDNELFDVSLPVIGVHNGNYNNANYSSLLTKCILKDFVLPKVIQFQHEYGY